jgi:hypothetical protein
VIRAAVLAGHAPLGALVDWGALGKVVWVSLVAGVGVTAVFSFAVLGAARASDSRRARRPRVAVAYTAFSLLCLALCAWAVWRGFAFVLEQG